MSSYSERQNELTSYLTAEYDNLVSYVKKRWRSMNESEAEDIVQDVALNLFTKVDFNAPVENLIADVYRSLKNKMIDLARKKHEVRLSSFTDEINGENFLIRRWVDEIADPDEREDHERRIRLMLATMEELPPEHQEIIIATEFEGYTFEELSQELGIPIGTLLSRKHRAIARLQKLMLEKLNKK
jgi:RNA polymerase sigma-70 factor (ECF subfamily)